MKSATYSDDKSAKVILYTDKGGKANIEIQLDNETVWLTLNSLAELFSSSKQLISYHLNRIYKQSELKRSATVKDILTVQNEGGRKLRRRLEYYDLDAVISVGYRVNSKRATQFRIWATDILRRHLVDGYTINQKLLKAKEEKFLSFQRAIKLIETVKTRKPLEYREAMGLLDVIRDYSRALALGREPDQ